MSTASQASARRCSCHGPDRRRAKAVALVCGIDGELAEVAARAVHFDADAGEKLAGGMFCQQDRAILHGGRKALLVGARAHEKSLNGKCGVDEGDQTRAVGWGGWADARGGIGWGGFVGHGCAARAAHFQHKGWCGRLTVE